MKRLGVIGDPIAHSLSPLIHQGWLNDAGIQGTYEALHVPEGGFDSALKNLTKSEFVGLNVTLPHKASALAAAKTVSDAARKIGAANTLTMLDDKTWAADNTDAPGFMSVLGEVDPKLDHVVIIGAGGSARALVYALAEKGFRVSIVNRTEARARAICEELGNHKTVYGSIDQLTDYIDPATIVVNTTSIGYSGQRIDLPSGQGRLFFDISYGAISAPQIAFAAEQGWKTKDGLAMLVAQAAYSFEIWFGQFPNLDAGMQRCREALEAKT